MAKILLIDDSEDCGVLVTSGLRPYLISQARSVADADAALKRDDYELLLIDISLPDGNGFDLCLRLCQEPRYKKVPKILLTAMDHVSEKVYGFSCGADDYLTKPFNPIELRARVDRYFRDLKHSPQTLLDYSCFSFDLAFQKCFYVDGDIKTDLGLTPTEFRLLLVFAKNEGQVLTRRLLEQEIWEANGTAIKSRGIDTHIAHLRKKLGVMKDSIISVYGKGYSFASEVKRSQAA